MKLRALTLGLVVGLAGCTSNEALNPSDGALGVAANTSGGTPRIGPVPETAAKQLTARDKAETLADLNNSARPGRAQASQN
ncbi:hypothetical protein N9H93_06525, partial [Rhizobiaceae bacterium]|nr:hypothetical protein [Rhizobiaceae bacterium]